MTEKTEFKKSLSQRWGAIAFKMVDSPYESFTVAALARNAGGKPWFRPTRREEDELSFYLDKSLDELLAIKGMDEEQIERLIDIIETILSFEDECNMLGSMDMINDQAIEERMRLIKQLGLYDDLPLAFGNIDEVTQGLCQREGVHTLIELMEFIDKLADKSYLGGALHGLQVVFAHGDEQGLAKLFPFRKGHRGFHFTEAVAFAYNRLTTDEKKSILEFHQKTKRSLFSKNTAPQVVVEKLVPEILKLLDYFSQKQPTLPEKLRDPDYLQRELLFLDKSYPHKFLLWLIQTLVGQIDENKALAEDIKMLNYAKPDPVMLKLKTAFAQSQS